MRVRRQGPPAVRCLPTDTERQQLPVARRPWRPRDSGVRGPSFPCHRRSRQCHAPPGDPDHAAGQFQVQDRRADGGGGQAEVSDQQVLIGGAGAKQAEDSCFDRDRPARCGRRAGARGAGVVECCLAQTGLVGCVVGG